MGTETISSPQAGRTAWGHRGCVGLLAITMLVTTSCGVRDRAIFEDGAGQLRAEVQRIVDDSAKDVSDEGDQTVGAVQQQLERHVPGSPYGQALTLARSAVPGRARVGFAAYSKIDGYGPGRGTMILGMCVEVSMAPPPDLATAIEDIDCSSQISPDIARVMFKP